MQPNKWLLGSIILFGGIAVLGSYVYGILSMPGDVAILWGGIPQAVRPVYTLGMLLGAAGFFVFTHFILFRLEPIDMRVTNRLGYGVFHALYAVILIPSALWLPLTSQAVGQASPLLAWSVRIDLIMVALGSLGLFYALLKVQPIRHPGAHRMALVSCAFFCIQTVVLDAILWGISFQV